MVKNDVVLVLLDVFDLNVAASCFLWKEGRTRASLPHVSLVQLCE